MHLLKRLFIGGLIASISPFAASILYCIYLTARYYDDKSMSTVKVERLALSRFPGKHIHWLCCHLVGLYALPFILLKRVFRTRSKREFRKIPVYTLPPELSTSLQEFMRSEVNKMNASSGNPFEVDREVFFRQ